MAGRLRDVNTGIASEPENGRVARASMLSHVSRSGVGADHVPGRVADDGVKSRKRPAISARVEEDLRKLELPMKESARRRHIGRELEILPGQLCRQDTAAGQNPVGQR